MVEHKSVEFVTTDRNRYPTLMNDINWSEDFPIESLEDLRNIRILCGWGGFENIADEGFKNHIISRCQELGLMDYLPDGWGGDERGFN
jgi:hypothetical protein